MYRSTNAGDDWSPANSGLPDLKVRGLVLSPYYASNHTLYVATYGAGVYRSSDEGDTWEPASNGIVAQIKELAISPAFGTDRTLFAGTWGGGVFKSTSGGFTWTSSGLQGLWVEGLGISPDFASDGTAFAATSSGVWHTTDGGLSWTPASNGVTNWPAASIVVSPDYPNDHTVFVGTRGGHGAGVFKTTDGGENWVQVNEGITDTIEHASVWALAISPTYASDGTVFAGLYYNSGAFRTTNGGVGWTQVITQGDVFALAVSPNYATDGTVFAGVLGDGVYRSTDWGDTWTHVLTAAEVPNVYTLACSLSYASDDTVYAAAGGGGSFNRPGQGGVWRSSDGGNTWEKVLYVSAQAGAADLIIDRTNPKILYASIWQVYRKAWMMWGGGPDSGLYKSENGGDTWVELTGNPGMPEAPIGKIGVTVSPADPERVWAIVEANEGGVFRSEDGGATWTRTNSERKLRQRSFYYSRVYADPFDRDTVYCLNTGFYKSIDGGKTFDIVIRPPHGDNHDLWIDPNDPLIKQLEKKFKHSDKQK